MDKKKIGLIAIVLFLIIGLGSFVFANPDNQENLKEGGTEEREGQGTDRDKKTNESDTNDSESSDGNVLTNDFNSQNNNQNNITRNSLGRIVDNTEGTGFTTGPSGNNNTEVEVTYDYYADALKAVENAESSLVQGDVDYATSLVDKVTNQSQKDELTNRLEAVQDIIDVTSLMERLENMVTNSTNRNGIVESINYRNDKKIEELVNNLKDGSSKDNLESRLETVNKILNDNESPVISGIENNSFTKKDVSLTITDSNEVTTTVTLNGKEIDYTDKFTEEGTYNITVVDAAFNETTLTFTIDKTKPVVEGVEDGKYYNTDVVITINDANPGTIHLKKDGILVKPFNSGDTIKEEGTYTVVVTDKASNKSKEITFVIDKTAPEVLTLTQKYENKQGGRIKVTITTSEEIYGDFVNKFGWRKAGENTYENYFYREKEVTIDATDKAGNPLNYTFTVDMTAPVVKSLGITDINEYKDEVGKLYAKNGDTVRVLIYFDEKLGTEPTVKLGGKEFTATYREASSINSEAYYADIKLTEDMNLNDGILSFEVSGYADSVGNIGVNLTEKDVNSSTYPSVTIDNTIPVLNFNNGLITSGYTVEATDDNFAYMTIQYFDGREMQTIESNTFTLDKDGDNTRYNIKAYDKAGNVSEYRDIYLDNTNPIIKGTAINGGQEVTLENNGTYQEVTLNISDGSLKKVSLVKEDGSIEELATYKDNYKNTKLTFEKKYTEEGTYTIKAVDRNKNESTITFTIDKTPATRVYSTLDFDKSGKQYNEVDGEKIYYVKNGDSFIFRMQFSEELKTAPTVEVGGLNIPMTLNEKYLNNEGKYIYEGTVNITEEAKLSQGRLEIILSNVIDMAGNESTDEVVVNQTPTSNGRVVVYDITSPEPKILGITGFFNETIDAHYITYGQKVRILTYYNEKLGTNPIVKIGNKEFETYYTEDSSDPENNSYAYYADITISEDLGLSEGEIPFTVYGHKDLAGNEGRAYTNADITYNENDKYENRYNKVILDNIDPKISIGGTTGEKYWFKEQTVNVTVTENNLDSIYYVLNQSNNDNSMHRDLDSNKATKVDTKDIIDNGDGTYTVKITINKEGRYVLNVKAVDKTGKATYARKGWYQIDTTDPTIVLHKNKNEEEITPGLHNYCVSATVSDKNIKSVKLNDTDYKSDTTICGDGNYTLTATDKAGNTKEINFAIDRTKPIIKINDEEFTGTNNKGMFYNKVDLSIIEANEYEVYVNDKKVDINEVDFNKDGTYKVLVKDKALNSTTVEFTVDTIPAALVSIRVNSNNNNKDVAKVGDKIGIYLNVDEELRENPTFTINGINYTVNQTRVNNNSYTYAVLYDVTDDMKEGEVEFTISNIYDKAGNQLADLSNKDTEEKVIIDKTAPELVVDKIVDGISGTDNPQVHAVDANEFNIVIKSNGQIVRTDQANKTSNGTYSTWYGIGYMPDNDYEVIATDKAGNSKTISFKLQRLELTDQKVGANLIDETNNTINNFNSFAIKFNNDITITNYSATNGFKIEYEYSTDGVNYTKSTGTVVNNYCTSVLGSSTTEKYQGTTFTIKAGEPIYYSGTKVGSRWSDIYEAIKATKDTDNKVYVRTIFTVIQPTYTKSFTLNEVTYSNGGTEVSPRGLAEF